MKKIIFITMLILSCIYVNAQDIIYKNDGTEIKAKVIELTTQTIKYKKFEQLNGPIRNILLSDVFMIIYKDGTREVIKAKNSNYINNQIKSNKKNPIISKNNVSIDIIDNRVNKIIGKAPSKAAEIVGLIEQPEVLVKDKKRKIYSFAKKRLIDVFEKKGFLGKNNSSYKLEVKINELYYVVRKGLYGYGGHISENCKVSIFLYDNDNLLFQKNFNSYISEKTKDFGTRLEILYKQYAKNPETFNRKENAKERREEFKEYSSKGHLIDFIIVFDDIANQLLNDSEFQNLFSK